MIVAGEASGDLHGAELSRELMTLDRSLRLSGIGGDGIPPAGDLAGMPGRPGLATGPGNSWDAVYGSFLTCRHPVRKISFN